MPWLKLRMVFRSVANSVLTVEHLSYNLMGKLACHHQKIVLKPFVYACGSGTRVSGAVFDVMF